MSNLQTQLSKLPAEEFAHVLNRLRRYFSVPKNSAALRLFVVGMAREKADKVSYLSIERGFRDYVNSSRQPFNVNEHTVRRFALGLRIPRIENFYPLLGLFCADALSIDLSLREHFVIQEAIAVSDFPSDIKALAIGGSVPDSVVAPQLPKLVIDAVRGAVEATSTMMQIRAQDQKTVASALFNQPEDVDFDSWKDRSFYAIYRYATTAGRIIKTFLVVNSPGKAEGGPNLFNFVHMYRAQKNYGNGTRVSRGVVTVLSDSVYFVGVGVRQRGPLFDRPDGLKIISAPAKEWDYDPTKIAAVYLSSNSKNGTIVGRAAFVHIGFESIIGNLTDEQIVPQPIEDQAGLLADLKTITSVEGGTHADTNPEDLAAFIYERITNQPFCDRDDPQAVGKRALVRENKRIPSDLL